MIRFSNRLRFPAKFLRVALVAVLAGPSILLSACSATASSDDFVVVTTTTQVTDFARNVMGGSASIYPLLQPNQSAHSFDPSARDLQELSRADVLIINGVDLEPWVDDAVSASGFRGKIIDSSARVTLISREGEPDPHVWTSPRNAIAMVEEIAEQLSELNPIDEPTYAVNTERFVQKLADLDAWVTDTVDQVPVAERLLVTNHDAFTYFVDAYDVTLVGSIIPEFDDNAEPSAADIDALIERIRDSGVTAIFAESSISPKLAQTVAAEAGIAVFAGDDSLYSDTLGPPSGDASTYIGATIHNVRLLALAWGVEPLSLPESLSHD